MKSAKKLTAATMTLWLMGCSEPIEQGDFCRLAEELSTTDRELAVTIVERDREFAKGINRHNELVSACK